MASRKVKLKQPPSPRADDMTRRIFLLPTAGNNTHQVYDPQLCSERSIFGFGPSTTITIQGASKRKVDTRRSTRPHLAFLLSSLQPMVAAAPAPYESSDEHLRRAASSPQLVRTRNRSNSASSSASLTATEDNYARVHERSYASTSRFPIAYPPVWTYVTNSSNGPAETDTAASGPSDESGSEDGLENDDLIFVSRASSSTSLGSGVRYRKGSFRRSRRESELPRMVTTARGQACAGETETEIDELPSRLPTSRIRKKSPPLIPLAIEIIVPCLFEISRLLSIVPSLFGIVYNIHHAFRPPLMADIQFSSIDFIICALWATLTGFQCLALTTGLLWRWKAYYTTPSTLIRLIALQCICWPATHFTLQFFDYTQRPVACWALIGTTTCFSRSVQLWVTSNLYMPVSVGDGKVMRAEGRLGPRRWDWGEVIWKCALPAGMVYFITAWALIIKDELGFCRLNLRVKSRTRRVADRLDAGQNYSRRVHTRSPRVVIGIRREDPHRIWERRCPLTPEAVEHLVHEDGFDVLVQPCERRIFKNEEFVRVGAKLHHTLTPAHILLGIKETPLNEILTDPVSNVPRTHLMFSHTHKGQEYNTPLLSRFLHDSSSHTAASDAPHLLPSLIDWELLTDAMGKRTVGFGWYAGVAGALEGLISTAQLHLTLGVASPFLQFPRGKGTPRPHTAPLHALMNSLKDIGGTISREGQVSAGALALLREALPTQDIAVDGLPKLVENSGSHSHYHFKYAHHRLTLYVIHLQTLLCTKQRLSIRFTFFTRRKKTISSTECPGNGQIEWHTTQTHQATYLVSMNLFVSTQIAPFTTLLINGVGWTQSSPRLMTVEQTADALMRVQKHREILQSRSDSFNLESRDVMKGRCQSFADVSCDIEGGLAFLPRSSTLSEPFFSLDLRSAFPNLILPSTLPPLQIMAVDILPTALPLEASETFSKDVLPYIRNVANRYNEGNGPMDDEVIEMQHALERATIASAGKLPSDQPSRNTYLCQGHPNATSAVIDMSQHEMVGDLIQKVDIVISLLPATFHPIVAELCIKHNRHLITASYISSAMRALHERAVNANVLLLNEIGLDPGIDHCSAIALLSSLRRSGEKILSFTSFCGGLPAPECADVPLKYKFSWSPRGALSAALNSARFLVDGKVLTVSEERLLGSNISNLPVSDVLRFEGLPNRDSLTYSSTYNLQELNGLKTLFRGTLRYPGFSRLLSSFRQIGLLDIHRTLQISSYSDLVRASIEDLTKSAITQPSSMLSALADLVPGYDTEELYNSLSWISEPDDNHTPSPPRKHTPVIDLFATLLSHKLSYKSQERDLVVLHHEAITSLGDSRNQVHHAVLEVYGTPKYSAMALCVGLPVATAALRVLDGGFKAVGVHSPDDPAMYEFVLQGMQERGLNMKHKTRIYSEGSTVEGRLREVWV
ncbi:hypothetical protein EW145_g6616 [Phellinidium pouzarii]|uniref:Alanine dehydrogenase/pyridine nucleotide transhydrogenase N-terminal domain-containing protein n=1 Tax=Phellinidium pouzarii TaxID=167371 RepID=A0A4S4KWK0_9AGAM|nr:hypothetical protein EW145_g6616 [Phellinidium pouzarii]